MSIPNKSISEFNRMVGKGMRTKNRNSVFWWNVTLWHLVTIISFLLYGAVGCGSKSAEDLESEAVGEENLEANGSQQVLGQPEGQGGKTGQTVKDGTTSTSGDSGKPNPDTTPPTAGDNISISLLQSRGLSLSWGAASDDSTESGEITYEIYISTTDNMGTPADAQANGSLVAASTGGDVALDIDNLDAETSYFIAVVAIDAAGNRIAYPSVPFTTMEGTAPVPGSGLVISSVQPTSLTVDWGAATDNQSATADIKYQLYFSTTNNLDNIQNVEANGVVAAVYSPGQLSSAVTSLMDFTSYYFAVIAKDEAGNKEAYPQVNVLTPDGTAPVAGAGLSYSSLTQSGVSVGWGVASDNASAAADIQYQVYMSQLDNIQTLADANLNGTIVMPFTPATLSFDVNGLNEAGTYYFAVAIQDQAGLKGFYSSSSTQTLDVSPPSLGSAIGFSAVQRDSLTVAWGPATDNSSAPEMLQYQLYQSSVNNLGTIADVEANGVIVAPYAAAQVSANVTGLAESQTYYYAVIVLDESGNKSLYASTSITTLDITIPVVGTNIVLSGETSTSINIAWGSATDNSTPINNIEYQVYQSLANDLDSVANTEFNGTIISSYAPGQLSFVASGLAGGTQYYFSVIVRDQSGNKSLYSSVMSSTLEGTAPVPGSGLVISSVQPTSLTVDWGAATDNVTAQGNIQYQLYQSLANNMGTVSDAEANGTIVAVYSAGQLSVSVTGLNDGGTFYFSVVAKDQAGNKSLYSSVSATTPDVTNPSIGAALSFSALQPNSLQVSWGAASDNQTAQSLIEYEVRMSLSNNISTIVDAETNGSIAAAYTTYGSADPVSGVVSGLSEWTIYYFAVIARDQAGNKSMYASVSQRTSDISPPTVSNGVLAVSGITHTGGSVSWVAATDMGTANLSYQLYYSLSSAVTTVVDVEANGTPFGAAGASLSAILTGLLPSKAYFLQVVVADEAGNKSVYVSQPLKTIERIHLMYSDATVRKVVYTNFAGSGWSVPTDIMIGIDSADDTRVRIDSSAKIHALFDDGTQDNLYYATNLSGAWSVTQIAGDNGAILKTGKSNDMVLDSNDKVHIGYFERNQIDTWYSTNVSGTFVNEKIHSNGDFGQGLNMTIDSSDKVYLAYADKVSGDGYMSSGTAGLFSSEYVSGGPTFTKSNIVITANGDTHILAYDAGIARVVYLSKPASTGVWSGFQVVDSGNVGADLQAVHDGSIFHACYKDIGAKSLIYLSGVPGSWVMEVVDDGSTTTPTSADVGDMCDISIGSNGYVHIMYYDAANADARYAYKSEGTWKLSNIATTGDVGVSGSLVAE